MVKGKDMKVINSQIKNKISGEFTVTDVIIYIFAALIGAVTLWPFIFILSLSLSSPEEAIKQSVWLLPKDLDFGAYIRVVSNKSLWTAYRNTIFYVSLGTFLNCLMSVLAAYPLSRPKLFGRAILVKFVIIPMYFTGGLVPYFILITKLGLYNNPLVMILPAMVSIWNIILVRTYMTNLPEALIESAVIDGASELSILYKIIIPLSKPILAVIALYSAVGIWNSWFDAMLFLPNRELHPLQLFLARMLVFEAPTVNMDPEMVKIIEAQMATVTQLKYAVIIIATLPIMTLYPFIQKYFIKGTLVGSLKG